MSACPLTDEDVASDPLPRHAVVGDVLIEGLVERDNRGAVYRGWDYASAEPVILVERLPRSREPFVMRHAEARRVRLAPQVEPGGTGSRPSYPTARRHFAAHGTNYLVLPADAPRRAPSAILAAHLDGRPAGFRSRRLATLLSATLTLFGVMIVAFASEAAITSFRVIGAVSDLEATRREVRHLWFGMNRYPDGIDLTPWLKAADAVPPGFGLDRGRLVHRWGGDVEITGQGVWFEISYDNLSREVCADLVTATPTHRFMHVRGVDSASGATPPVADPWAICAMPNGNTVTWAAR